MQRWNGIPVMAGMAGLEPVKQATAKRHSALKQRLASVDWQNTWEAALDQLAESVFAQGGGEKGWRGTIDWFLRPDTVARILEGRYGERQRPAHDPRGNLAAMDEFLRRKEGEHHGA